MIVRVRRALIVAAALWLAGLLAGFQAAPQAAPRPATAGLLHGHGTLLVAYDHTLALRTMASGAQHVLFQFSDDEYIRSPVWLPDGSGFLFIDQRAYNGDRTVDYGGDIWEANADGSGSHIIWHHDVKGADLANLALAPDGSWLLFDYLLTQLSPQGVYLGQVIEMRRLDMTTLQATKLLDQASNPAISPDGTQIVYLDVADSDDPVFGLWVSNVDGSNPQPVVMAGNDLISMVVPHFSPDGNSLLFAAVPNRHMPQGLAPAAQPRPAAWNNPFAATVASADGPPQDIWTVHLDGTGLQRLTTINEDQPTAAWSADGSQIAVYGSTGMYLVNADGSSFTRLGDAQLHAQIAWWDQ